MWSAVRSVSSSRAAAETFQSVWSSACRIRSRSAEWRTSCSPAAGARGVDRPDFQRDRLGGDSIAGREDRHPLHHVPQLADVARPGVALERRDGVGIDRPRPEVVPGAELGQEVRHELGNVLHALAQRRHANRHDAEAVVEILPEPAVRDELVEPPVGRRDDAGGHPDRLLAAHALELAILQDAEQLRLRRLVQIADFVEKDRAAVGQLELAAPERRRAGERPLLMAEELALDQLGRNRGAVHFHERTRGERAFAMDVGGQQLLAGPGLSRQQHADVGSRHLGRLLHGVLERGRRSDHPRRVPDQLAEALVLALQVRPLERVLDDQQHAVARERLLEELERAHLRRLNRVGNRAVTGDHHDGRTLVPLPHRP